MRSVRAACARRARGERAMSEQRASGARRRARIQESQAGSGRLLGFEELVGAGAIRKLRASLELKDRRSRPLVIEEK